MYVLYDTNSYNVLDRAKRVEQDGEYYIVHRNDLRVKYRSDNIGLVFLPNDKIASKDGFPLIYDIEQESVYPDPFYVEDEEEIQDDDGSDDDSGEERPMSVMEMRSKIKELEEELAAIKILLGVNKK